MCDWCVTPRGAVMSRLDRMRAMVRELEELAEAARVHEQRMAEGLRESLSWSSWEEREWIAWAAAAAKVAREDTEARVAQGRALLARVQSALDLGLRRCVIVRCGCGSLWPVVAQ